MKRILLLLFLTSCATATAPLPPPAPPSPLWVGLAPGPYAVGFRVTTGSVPVSVWYPAERAGTPMTYRDYVLLDGADEVGAMEKFLTSNGVSAAATTMLLDEPMFASRDAAAIPAKRFPLVFIAQGNGGSAQSQAVLAEFLASHGHVVTTIPSITRLTGPMQSENDVVPKAEAEAANIERAVTEAAQWPNVAPTPVALVAHSFGARSALFYAMHHPASAFVSLEGGIGVGTAQQAMVASRMMDLGASFPPVLHFYELNDDRMTPDLRLLHSVRAPELQLVRMNSMRHVHFSIDGFASVLIPDLARVTKAGPDLKQEVMATAQQTLEFIDKQAPKK